MTDNNFDEIAKTLKPIGFSPLPEKPLVSVLMSNYNYAKYVGEAIESVLNQTYQNFEIVVCDDGSADNSLEVVSRYVGNDPRVRLVAKKNGGVASALSAAYAASRGEIVCLLDADDLCHPKRIERLVSAFRSSERSGACLHRIVKMYSDGTTFNCPVPVVFPEGWLGPEALQGGGIPKSLPSRAMPESSGMSFRRPVTDAIFPIPHQIGPWADGYLSYAALFITEFCAVPEVLSQLRIHGHNNCSVGEYKLQSVTRNTEGLALFVGGVRDFLRHYYGDAVASCLRVEDNSLYCSGRLLMHVLGDDGKRRNATERPEKWVEGIHPRRQKILAQLLLLLPPSAARRALRLWRGLTPTDAAMLRFTRFLLRI